VVEKTVTNLVNIRREATPLAFAAREYVIELGEGNEIEGQMVETYGDRQSWKLSRAAKIGNILFRN
jgi:hypothetical protein